MGLQGKRKNLKSDFTLLIFKRTQLLGVCSTISPTGPAHGKLGGRFIVAFFASLASVVHKGISIALVLHFFAKDDHSNLSKILFVMMLFTPQVLMSSFCTIGFSKKSFELFLDHVDLILQPAGICYTSLCHETFGEIFIFSHSLHFC